ncbi:S8 family serine peptidase [Halosimplex salinum]|uniref:S8 family serine peptidase n=1 Tax=Halosimplex salinum TaxID=1710538 RepID=UPI0013DDAFB8|nr:S8 family serine peptidase [Halosimplex salinum]
MTDSDAPPDSDTSSDGRTAEQGEDATGSFDMNVGTPEGSDEEDGHPDAPSMGIDVDEESERVDVLVEMRVEENASMFSIYAMADTIEGYDVDREFDPVWVKPTEEERLGFDSDSEGVVLVRGRVDRSRLDEVRSQVENVWEDRAVLQPFERSTETGSGESVSAPEEPFESVEVGTEAAAAGDVHCPSEAIGSLDDGSITEYLGVDDIWADGVRGDGVVVGVVDGGITAEGRRTDPSDTSQPGWPGEKVPNVTDGYPPDSWGTTGRDWNWHGNMTATDVLGIAPEVELYDIRLTGRFASSLISAVDWAIRKHAETGTPHVLNVSAGIYQRVWDPDLAESPDHPATRKVLEAVDAGIIVLFAAGNCGEECANPKCRLRPDPETDNVGRSDSIWGVNGHERVITVGAASLEEKRLGYSSQGPSALNEDGIKPDFCSISHFEGYNDIDSGTSAATPIAAGVVALLKQVKPDLTAAEAKRALQSTAKDVSEPGPDYDTGAGIVQAADAYEEVRPASSPGFDEWTAVTGDLLYSPGVVSTADDRLDLFMFGYDMGLYVKEFRGGSWQDGVTLVSDELAGLSAPAVAARDGGGVDVFAVGPERELYRLTLDERGDRWVRRSGWESVGSGPCLFAPAAVARDSGVDVFAVRGADGERYLYRKRFEDGSGEDWERLGGVCTSAPAAVSTGADELDVFARGGDGAVHRKQRRDGEWGTWAAIDGTVCGGVSAAANGDAIELFASGSGGRVVRSEFSEGSWSDWESVGRTFIETPETVARGSDAVDVFAVAPNTNVLHRTRRR